MRQRVWEVAGDVGLRWEFTDSPKADALDAVDAGLHLYNLAAADLGAVRAIGRSAGAALLNYGVPEGYLPLRQQLSQGLAQAEIGAAAEQLITTHGVTHGIDLVARHFIAPGDTVFVEDPAWYVIFGRERAATALPLIATGRVIDGFTAANLRHSG